MSEEILFDIGTATGRIKSANTKMRKKEAKLFVERELPTLQKKYKFVSRLATLVYNPHITTLEQAWIDIPRNVIAIKEVLSQPEFNCIYALLTIEMHTASHAKKKTEDTSPPDEDAEDSTEQDTSTKEVTLLNYPHIHIAIAVNAPRGRLPDPKKLARAFFEATTFGDDIHVDEASMKNKGKNKSALKSHDNENILLYCLKDSNHEMTYRMLTASLGKKEQSKEILLQSTANNTILFNYSQDSDITEFFYEITKRGCIISLPERSSLPSDPSSSSTQIKTSSNSLIADTKSKFSVTLTMLVDYMNQNNLRKYEDDVFTLKEGTRRTWKKWGTMEDVYGKLCTLENEEYLSDILSNKSKVLDLASLRTQSIIPTLSLDWNFIEFEDFYLHLPSFSVLTSELPSDKQLAIHIGSFSLEELKKSMNDISLLEPEFWLAIINNQDFSNNPDDLDEFFVRYYKTLLPLIQKDKVLTLYGVANSGKTSAIEPLSRIIPRFATTQFSSGQFKYSNLINKRLVIADDTKSKILDELDALNILEGNKTIVADRKFKDAIPFSYAGNTVIALNSFPKSWQKEESVFSTETFTTTTKEMIQYISKGVERYELKPEYSARLSIYIFGNVIKEYKPGYIKSMSEKELAKIVLFTGLHYSARYLSRDTDHLLTVSDDYDDEYRALCNDMERIFDRND